MTEDIEELMHNAIAGDSLAQYQMGICYWHGDGIEQNYAMAKQWLERSAAQDDPNGVNGLGVIYYRGLGVTKDNTKAVSLFRKAANMGLAKAQSNLGMAYYYGEGEQQNYAQALTWLLKAAEQGNVVALFYVGVCYFYGQGIERNAKIAFSYYEKAAKQDYSKAQFFLGELYLWAEGVERNLKRAEMWFSKAAQKGYEDAEQRLTMVRKALESEEIPEYVKGTKSDNTADSEVTIKEYNVKEFKAPFHAQRQEDVEISHDYVELASALFCANYEKMIAITSAENFDKECLIAEPSVENGLPIPLYCIPLLVKIVCNEEVLFSHATAIREVRGLRKAELKKIAYKRRYNSGRIMEYLHEKFKIEFCDEVPFRRYEPLFMAGSSGPFFPLRTSADNYIKRGFREIDVLLYMAGRHYDFISMKILLLEGASPTVELKTDKDDCGVSLTDVFDVTRFLSCCSHNPLNKNEITVSHNDLCNLSCWAAMESEIRLINMGSSSYL